MIVKGFEQNATLEIVWFQFYRTLLYILEFVIWGWSHILQFSIESCLLSQEQTLLVDRSLGVSEVSAIASTQIKWQLTHCKQATFRPTSVAGSMSAPGWKTFIFMHSVVDETPHRKPNRWRSGRLPAAGGKGGGLGNLNSNSSKSPERTLGHWRRWLRATASVASVHVHICHTACRSGCGATYIS